VQQNWKKNLKSTMHICMRSASFLKENMPNDDKFEETGLTPFALAMPVEFKTEDPIESYRNYYMSEEKQKIASWKKNRSMPDWYRITSI
jgi:hypothetical protein